MGGGGRPVRRTKTLGSGWKLLEWAINSGFSIRMHTSGIKMCKVWCWIYYGETSGDYLSISWWQTIPWGGIAAKDKQGQTVEYTYTP